MLPHCYQALRLRPAPGVHDTTAWRCWRAGRLDASQVAAGASIVRASAPITVHPPAVKRVAVSARVSAAQHRPHLERQADRLVA